MLIVGKKFGLHGRYDILSILGKGGMGIVVKAYDTILKEFVAIKTLHPKLVNNESIKNRFLNEAKLCLALTHPNIIRVRDVSVYNGIYYMVMEYIQGVELKSILKDYYIKDIQKSYTLIRPILDALSYAHNYTIHRDIKPANIMIKDNIPYLMDFGISKALVNSELTNDTEIGGMGTKKYASPEQMFNANDVDKTTDIYSMGIMLYELFTLKVPQNTAIQSPKKPSEYNKNISPALDSIILKMIEPKPKMRYNNCDEILKALDKEIFDHNSHTIPVIHNKTTSNSVENVIGNVDLENDDFVLIKGGNFLRGSGLESKLTIDKPRKTIFVDTFYICKYCVTNKQYKKFLDESKYDIIPNNFELNLSNKPKHPVVYVSYFDALKYCEFYGYSLPTEAQWEKVAKGKNFIYPWGNEFESNMANIGHVNNSTVAVDDYENGKSKDGVYNLCGNVWEWCIDDFDENFYKTDNITNPVCKNNSELKVIRGGSFNFIKNGARASFRFNTNELTKAPNIGFRVVKNKD